MSHQLNGLLTMNLTESAKTTEWSSLPDAYEIEIKANPKYADINPNSIGNESAFSNNDTLTFQGTKVLVRPEEALIVIFVLIMWAGAIGLFVHRWGKIRNCEPYTPKFEADDHRGSCHDQTNLINKRMSMSNKISTPGPSHQNSTASQPTTATTKSFSPNHYRMRQNSVFAPPLNMTPPTLSASRRTKSALDLHSMIYEDDYEIV